MKGFSVRHPGSEYWFICWFPLFSSHPTPSVGRARNSIPSQGKHTLDIPAFSISLIALTRLCVDYVNSWTFYQFYLQYFGKDYLAWFGFIFLIFTLEIFKHLQKQSNIMKSHELMTQLSFSHHSFICHLTNFTPYFACMASKSWHSKANTLRCVRSSRGEGKQQGTISQSSSSSYLKIIFLL
jgi:hypothetical protein